MTRPKLIVMSKGIAALTRLDDAEFDLILPDGQPDRDAYLREKGPGTRAMLAAGMERLDAARLDLLPDLELIAVVAAGMSGIDLDACRARGIKVTNAGDINSADVAEYAVTMLLAHRREVLANHQWVVDDQWMKARRSMAHSVSVQKVGIVGLGYIGQEVAKRLAPFGCEIAWWGPRDKPGVPWPRMADLDALSAWATTLVVAARGDDSTRGLITASMIDALGPDGLIVNVARGFVIDQPAMIAALKEGRLGGAALDVFDPEPIRGSDWADIPNVLMAPHVAGATHEALNEVVASAVRNVRALFSGGELRHRVI